MANRELYSLEEERQKSIDALLITFVTMVALVAIALFVLRFAGHPLGPPETWGQFGDYLGGVVNPVVGIVTALLVARTLNATRREAADTRAELKNQTMQFEQQIQFARDEAHAADVRRQLDGILADFRHCIENEYYDSAAPIFVGMTEYRGGVAFKTIFESSDIYKGFDYAVDHAYDQVLHGGWVLGFRPVLQLLRELDDACSRYESLSGSKSFTNYFRRRVRREVAFLSHNEILDREVAKRLAPPHYV